MVEAVYEKLIDALNARSTFLAPAVKCDEFFALAAYLYSPVEAEIACAMPPGFATAREIAANIPGSHPDQIAGHLETMANKAVIHSKEKNGETLYELLPLFPGVMELQFYRTGEDEFLGKLDILLAQYLKAMRALLKSGALVTTGAPSPGRKVAIGQEVYSRSTIIPYTEMKELIMENEYIGTAVCHCRHVGEQWGKPCSKPMDNCMIFGTSAKFTIEKGLTSRLTTEQALQVLDEAEKAGLIHQYGDTPDHYSNILCNCCSCHCIALKGYNKSPVPSEAVIARYLVKIDDEACTICEACLERCQMGALKMDGGKLSRDESRCIGCGLCMYVCPTEALTLDKRPAGKIPLKKC
ncbi:MAG: 4Fe-4S binding protein [Chloroflexi bacterium]|nr:4Fe-4S binding protein [Chloroflexota bacterium]